MEQIPSHDYCITPSREWSDCCRCERLAREAKESLSGVTGIFCLSSICRYFLFWACYRLACMRLRRNTRLGKLHPWNMKYCKNTHGQSSKSTSSVTRNEGGNRDHYQECIGPVNPPPHGGRYRTGGQGKEVRGMAYIKVDIKETLI